MREQDSAKTVDAELPASDLREPAGAAIDLDYHEDDDDCGQGERQSEETQEHDPPWKFAMEERACDQYANTDGQCRRECRLQDGEPYDAQYVDIDKPAAGNAF